MDEERVWNILGDSIDNTGGLSHTMWYLYWDPTQTEAVLDGEFTADDLEAIAWWMRNKKQ